MKRSTGKYLEILAVAAACAAVVALNVPTLAQTKFLERVRKHYVLDRNNGKCDLCHQAKAKEEPGRKNLNIFGKAIQSHPDMKPLLGKDDKYSFSIAELDILEAVVVKLENEDSDGDGVTNKEELDLGSYPGDPKSVPDKVKLAQYRKQHPSKSQTASGGGTPTIGPRKN